MNDSIISSGSWTFSHPKELPTSDVVYRENFSTTSSLHFLYGELMGNSRMVPSER